MTSEITESWVTLIFSGLTLLNMGFHANPKPEEKLSWQAEPWPFLSYQARVILLPLLGQILYFSDHFLVHFSPFRRLTGNDRVRPAKGFS